uniref:Uncharacterized protein n=1 Tax=Opuntia streptacantha TaxID=393608 RepID=A0A7C9AGC1_OPUST
MRSFSERFPQENMHFVASKEYKIPFSRCSTQPLSPTRISKRLSLVPVGATRPWRARRRAPRDLATADQSSSPIVSHAGLLKEEIGRRTMSPSRSHLAGSCSKSSSGRPPHFSSEATAVFMASNGEMGAFFSATNSSTCIVAPKVTKRSKAVKSESIEVFDRLMSLCPSNAPPFLDILSENESQNFSVTGKHIHDPSSSEYAFRPRSSHPNFFSMSFASLPYSR